MGRIKITCLQSTSPNTTHEIVQVIKPAVGDSETGFAYHLGEFDSLVDTIGNERASSGDDDGMISFGASTLQLLKSQHKCYNYVSTMTNSQDIVANEGIIWGPGKADGYSEKVGNRAFLMTSRDGQSIVPPRAIGYTLEKLMENGVILTEKQRSKACSKKSDAIRGWSLPDFWEQMSWPRDSSGSGTTRFGLPVRDVPDEDDFFLLAEDSPDDIPSSRRRSRDDDDGSASSSVKTRAIQTNPYVSDILNIDDFQNEIVQTEKNCIMFMSARWCRTCKTINPSFTRMARINEEEGKANNFSFVKAETATESGKRLARLVSVRAVPSFVFVREGKVLGEAYVSKLPSPKIEKAMAILMSNADWDDSLCDDDDDDE